MQHRLAYSPPLSPEMEPNPSFNVVVAYEDFETGKRAKETYDFLVDNLGCDCHFTNQMWKFDVLLPPKLRDIAIEDATGADLIIVSSRGRELPIHVQCWIDGWLVAEHKPLALVALFECSREEAGQANAAHVYLAKVARQGGLEFFAQPDDSHAGFSNPSRLVDKKLSTIAGVFQRDPNSARWSFDD